MSCGAVVAVLVETDDLAGGHLTDERGANGAEGARLGGDHIAAVFQLADAQRAEPLRVPHPEDGVTGEHHQGVCALGLAHETGDPGFPVGPVVGARWGRRASG